MRVRIIGNANKNSLSRNGNLKPTGFDRMQNPIVVISLNSKTSSADKQQYTRKSNTYIRASNQVFREMP